MGQRNQKALLLASIVAIGCLVLSIGSGRAADREYSTAPLSQNPIQPTVEVLVDVMHFNNWLVEKRDLTAAEYPPIREHAFLLIDSILKIRQQEGRTSFNESERFMVEQMFNLSTRVGVYGAGLVAQDLAAGSGRKVTKPLLPEKPFRLRLEQPYFLLSSKAAPWRIKFPYYFMFWEASRFTATNQLLTDVVVLSTSFSKHDQGAGASQATIMFIYAPKADCDAFAGFWLERMGINRTENTPTVVLPDSRNFHHYDSAVNMHKEVTMFSDATGCYALSYSGIAGPYQANRISYLDFARSLEMADE